MMLPGDMVTLPSPKVGPGLCAVEESSTQAVVSIPGLLKGVEPGKEEQRKRQKSWVDYSAKRVHEAKIYSFYLFSCSVCSSSWRSCGGCGQIHWTDSPH